MVHHDNAVRTLLFLLPWGYFFCGDSCGPPQKTHNLWYTRKLKKKNKNKNTTMMSTSTNFYRRCENFARDGGICKVRKGRIGRLENSKRKAEFAWFWYEDVSAKAAIFFFASWIILPKWARVAYFSREDSLKINRSVKTPWHRLSVQVMGSWLLIISSTVHSRVTRQNYQIHLPAVRTQVAERSSYFVCDHFSSR